MDKSVFDTRFQQQDTVSKIVVGLERISEAFRVLLWDHAKTIGISPIQIQLLIFIAYHDESLCQVSHLAEEFNMTKATVSDAVRVLLNKQLVEKRPSATDGRAFAIALTSAGQAIVDQTQYFAQPIRDSLQSISTEDQQQLFAQLSRLIYRLNRAGILTVQRTCYACRFYERKSDHHFCNLLRKELWHQDIRVDCPEFEPSS